LTDKIINATPIRNNSDCLRREAKQHSFVDKERISLTDFHMSELRRQLDIGEAALTSDLYFIGWSADDVRNAFKPLDRTLYNIQRNDFSIFEAFCHSGINVSLIRISFDRLRTSDKILFKSIIRLCVVFDDSSLEVNPRKWYDSKEYSNFHKVIEKMNIYVL
jgi:hypothetical protein